MSGAPSRALRSAQHHLLAMIPRRNAFVSAGALALRGRGAAVALRGCSLTTARRPVAPRAAPHYATLASPRVDDGPLVPAQATAAADAPAPRASRDGSDDLLDDDLLAVAADLSINPADEALVEARLDYDADDAFDVVVSDRDAVRKASRRGMLDAETEPAAVADPDGDALVPEKREIKNGMGPPLTDFRISSVTVERLAKNGITRTTEVQAGTFDLLYDGGDIIAKSRTGTGKTLAFALPIMERLAILKKEGGRRARGQGPGCLVLAPTRELAKQVAREMLYIGEGLDLSVECIYGGVGYGPQESALRKGVDVVVGTPGRIMDHLERGTLRLESIKFAVLDEADEMLSMGFAQDVETVFQTLPAPEERQVILFSATVPSWVKNLASQYQRDVVVFDAVTRGPQAATTVRHCALRVPESDDARAHLLADIIAVYSRPTVTPNGSAGGEQSRAIVFTQTKREADELATSGALEGCGAAVLHGDVSQKQREVTLAAFRRGSFQVLVATDVAARGLDISGVDVVVQYRVPQDSDAYIHRAGRTGRAGKSGTAVVMYSDREQGSLRQLERVCKIKFDREAAPGPEMALEAAVDVAMAGVPKVDARVTSHLTPRAEKMLEESENPSVLLASILAIAGRRTEMPDRSLLSGEKGMRALLIKGPIDISPGLALRFVSETARLIDCDERVGLIRMCRDGSAVLDVPSGVAESLVEAASRKRNRNESLELSFAIEVPALRDDDRRSGSRGSRANGGRYGAGRSVGRYGNGRSREGGSYFRDGGYARGRSGGGYARESGGYSRAGGYRDGSRGYSRDNGRSFGGSRYGDDDGSYGFRRGDRRGRRNAEFLEDDF